MQFDGELVRAPGGAQTPVEMARAGFEEPHRAQVRFRRRRSVRPVGDGVAGPMAGKIATAGGARHQKSDERAITRVRAVAFVIATSLSVSAWGAKAAEPEAVEYKLSLSPHVARQAGREKLWRVIGGGERVSQKNCRLIRFLEADGNGVDREGFIVRHRVKLDHDACPDEAPDPQKGELTVKFRDPDLKRNAHQSEKPWSGVGDHKFEIDVAVAGKAAQTTVSRVYSLSATIEDAEAPETVGGLRDDFPEALGALRAGVRLSSGCRRVLEERWELKTEASGLPPEIELAVWCRVARDGRRERDPLLVELSCKGSVDHAVAADALAARLMRDLDPDLLAEGGSKTSAISKCGRP